MNTITLTDEQYKALRNGESITIKPPEFEVELWKPKRGNYTIHGNGEINEVKSAGSYIEFGNTYSSKKQAEKASAVMRTHNRLLCWLSENDDGWKVDWGSCNDKIVSKVDAKYLYINNKILYGDLDSAFRDDEFEEVDADLFIRTKGTCEEDIKLSIFEQYGFEVPYFECKLFEKLHDEIFGAYFNPNKQKWIMCRWDEQGNNKQGSYNYRLEPLIKPWYETCNFPILVKDSISAARLLSKPSEWSKHNSTPLTDDEIEQLKQGF